MKRSSVLFLTLICIIVSILNINRYLTIKNHTTILFAIDFISFLISVGIMFGNKKTESKVAWVIFILIFPIIGIIFYILLGVEYNRFKKFDANKQYGDNDTLILPDDKKIIENLLNKIKVKKDVANLIYNTNKNRISINSKTEILNNGDMKFKRLIEELKKAKKFINIEYFIIKDGKIFDEILKILIEKSNDGVEVRILMDDFGCVDISKQTIKKMKKNKIKVAFFNKINFKLLRPSINYRNHRKILIIDNKVGFTGGINIGDEYAHKDKYYGFWRDTHILIEGSAVSDMNLVFIKDWYNTTGEDLYLGKYLKKHIVDNQNSMIQIVDDGPDKTLGILRKSFFKMINEANKRVWITTPYLILDVELTAALKVAALSGIDVRIIVPGKHDKGKLTTYKATEAYFSELLESGVKIYRYKDLFIHSKILIIDDDLASVGTVNFDYRSFDLHFEITALLYLDPSIEVLIKSFEDDLQKSTQVVWEEWKNRNKLQKFIESLVKIFSPLL